MTGTSGSGAASWAALGTWWASRLRLAAWALAASLATGALLAAVDPAVGFGPRGPLYVGVTGLALFFPAAIAAQVVLGQVLIASLVIGGEGVDLILLVPAMAGVVATAELLAVVARLDAPVRREAEGALRGAGSAAALGGGVFCVVALTGAIPGPAGLLAVLLAAGACIVLAAQLVRRADEARHRRP
jgi:hypothetical protein